MEKPASASEHMHAGIGSLIVAALIIVGVYAGYSAGQARVEYIDRVVDRIVKEPHEVRVEVPIDRPVPGPTVYVPVPGRTIVKKVFVRVPQHCPPPPSIADALNEYEAITSRSCSSPR